MAIACGGTGGHIYPALALSEWMGEYSSGVEMGFVVTRSERTRRMMSNYTGKVRYIGARPMPARISPAMLLFACSLLGGLVTGMAYLARERPDVVLGMGGYGSAPLVLAARLLGFPTVIHEQNIVPGRANAFLARWVDRVALSFPSIPGRLDRKKAVVTGNPVRRKVGAMSAEEARARLGLREDRFTVLLMGGSRGARFLNECGPAAASMLPPERFQWVHIAGEEDYGRVGRRYGEIGVPHYCTPFTGEIEIPYAASDMAVCRAGATTIAELATCGLPALFIPYPHAVGSHQSLNAGYLAERGAALVLEQDAARPDMVASIISGLEAGRDKLAGMGRSLKGIFEGDASRKLAEVVLSLAKKGIRQNYNH